MITVAPGMAAPSGSRQPPWIWPFPGWVKARAGRSMTKTTIKALNLFTRPPSDLGSAYYNTQRLVNSELGRGSVSADSAVTCDSAGGHRECERIRRNV